MRSTLIALLVLGITTVEARAQGTGASSTAATPSSSESAVILPPGSPAGSASTTSAAVQVPAAAGDRGVSLFDPIWNQFELSGRWTSVEGDAARFQRFQDKRSGLLFTSARYSRDWSDGRTLQATADNTGFRDQRYFGSYEQPGRLVISGLWDEVPQFYSIDTKTAYETDGATLTMPDAAQQAIQSGQANLNAYVPISGQFDLLERRDTGLFSVKSMPTVNLDITGYFRTIKHSGELPWGAGFGFSNDVEVPLPYDSRTNDVNVGAEWHNNLSMLRVAYDGSWFNNNNDPLVWDNPLRLADSATSGPGHGRMAIWPTHTAHTISGAGYRKFARRTQVTGFLSYGVWSQDEPLNPFTINAALPQLPLPRTTSEAAVHVTSANLGLVSRPVDDWRFSARWRLYDFNNETTELLLPQMVSYDTSIRTTPTGGPELFARTRNTLSADATWTGLPVALTFGYTRENGDYLHRIFESTGEDIVSVKADVVSTSWMILRANYEHSSRTGDGLDEASLVQIGEQPRLRHYDVANRDRDRFVWQVDFVPNETLTFSLSNGVGSDDYPDSALGLQEADFATFTTGVDAALPNGLSVGGSYTYEKYTGFQTSRSASSAAEAANPARDWTADSEEQVHYFSIYVTPPRIGQNTEVRGSYDWSDARTNFLYGVVPGGPLATPSQLPEVFNTLQQLRLDVRHRLTPRLTATLSYLYEPFDIYDFAFDQSVIDGIVQPSTLVMGYVYRPYTAHSAVGGIVYSW
jgi:MtrB/PioB family decaheme-associated outer membrane protein